MPRGGKQWGSRERICPASGMQAKSPLQDRERDEHAARLADLVREVRASTNPLRLYKRRDGVRCKDEAEDVLFTLFEYEARR